MAPQFVFKTLCTKHLSLTNADDFNMIHMGFRRTIFYCSDVYIHTEVEPCFVHTKQIVQHLKPCFVHIKTNCATLEPLPVKKNHVVYYRITVQLVANRTETRQ